MCIRDRPTTCGTGSEATPYSILTSHIKQTKKSIAHKIFPSLALVDYGYLKTSSYSGMKSTCVDALAHMIESRLNTNANAFSRAYAEEGMRLWASCKGCLETEERFAHMTDDEFSTFMQASVLAGMAIAYTGTSIPHGLSYTLTYENGIPHGKAVGVFLSGFLKKYGDSTEAGYVVNNFLALMILTLSEIISGRFLASLICQRSFGRRTETEYLPTLPSLKIILLSLRQICLTITFAIITHKKAVRVVALTAFLLHLCKPVYLCKFSFCEVKAVKTAYVFRYLLRTACADKHSSNSLVVKHP